MALSARISHFWTHRIAWRFSYLKVFWKYLFYLKNYREALPLRHRREPVRLVFRNGVTFTSSNAESSLHIFDEIFVAEDYRISGSKAEKIILDIGANIGLFSIYALFKNPKAKIYSIEADPEVFQALAQNIKRNSFEDKIKIFNLAITSSCGHITLYSAKHSGWSSVFNALGAENGSPVNVESTTLSAFCEKNGISGIDYLKIDIEGAEFETILGDKDFFKIPAKAMVVEADRDSRDKNYSFEDLLRKIRSFYQTVSLSSSKAYPLIYGSRRKESPDHGI